MVGDAVRASLHELVESDRAGLIVTVVAGDGLGIKAVLGGKGELLAGSLPEDLRNDISSDAKTLVGIEKSVTLSYGSTEVFFEMIAPRPRLFVFGAVHIAQELVSHANLLGFHTIVADPRPAFVTADRFPGADEVRVGWPDDVCDADELDERTFVVVLSHDRRFEDPLWPIALRSRARYIGAMGSSKTTARRRERLLASGFTEDQADRIHGPVGISIGSRTAGETAIAIIAEMISVRYAADAPLELAGRQLRP